MLHSPAVSLDATTHDCTPCFLSLPSFSLLLFFAQASHLLLEQTWRNGSLLAQERIRIKSGWRRRAEALAEKFYDGRVRSWKTFTPVRRTLLQATGGYGFGAG